MGAARGPEALSGPTRLRADWQWRGYFDEHPSADQLIADVSGWAGVPGAGGDASGLGEDVVTAVGELAQLFDGFVKVAALGGVPHCGAVEGAVEKLIRGGHV